MSAEFRQGVAAAEVPKITQSVVAEQWTGLPDRNSVDPRGCADLSNAAVAGTQAARSLLVDGFSGIAAQVADTLGVAILDVAAAVAVALCPPVGRTKHHRDASLISLVEAIAGELSSALSAAECRGSIAAATAKRLRARSPIDALAAIVLGYRSNELNVEVRHELPFRSNALLVTATYIDEISRWAANQLNRMLYGQLAPRGEDPFDAHLGDGFGLEIAFAIARGGCAALHESPSCSRRRHRIQEWDPADSSQPPSLYYWLSNLLVGPRGHRAESGERDAQALQAGALQDGILIHRLDMGVVKALVLKCRDCQRVLDGVSFACREGRRPNSLLCPLFPQFDDKRIVLHPELTMPAPIRCLRCSAAVVDRDDSCPACESTLYFSRRRSLKTYLPAAAAHPGLGAFRRRTWLETAREDAILTALLSHIGRATPTTTALSAAIRLVADELGELEHDVIAVAEAHSVTLRDWLEGNE